MELKVWVEGIQRIVCGVTVNTTCQDVVFALAHATGKVGRFTLIERWRNNERLLAPNENPLKLLLKWGEYANDVQFILQRSEQNPPKSPQNQHHHQQHQQQHQQQQQQQQRGESINNHGRSPQTINAVMKKPFGLSNSNNNNNNNNNINNNNVINSNEMVLGSQQKRSHQQVQATVSMTLQHQQQQQQQQQQQCNESNSSTTKEFRKSFGAYDMKHMENVGIVKGIPQCTSGNMSKVGGSHGHGGFPRQQQNLQPITPKHEKSHSNPIEMSTSSMVSNGIENNSGSNYKSNNNIYSQIGVKSKSTNEINLAEVRSSLDRRATASPEAMFSASSDNLLDIFNSKSNSNSNGNGNGHYSGSPDRQLYKNTTPIISANGALVPPPYRDPPPPRNSPLQYKVYKTETCQNSPVCKHCNGSMIADISAHGSGVCSNPFLNDCSDFELDLQGGGGSTKESESIFQAAQYSDLLTLIKFQREKISLQQSELNKSALQYDAEIVYLENKERDQTQELEAISREITKADQIFRQGSEQLQTLQYVEEENELVKQQEKTLKSEIALLRSKLTNCETELLQCKNKMRILMDDVEVEQRSISTKQKNNRQSVERDFLMEMERIQSEIDQAIHSTDTTNKTTENLKKEIALIENAIAEKKRQVEHLVNEMKEVNLRSLTVTTSEEIRHLLEGSNKPGSSRRIIGSPRQLETAVPTSKNPHGVWV